MSLPTTASKKTRPATQPSRYACQACVMLAAGMIVAGWSVQGQGAGTPEAAPEPIEEGVVEADADEIVEEAEGVDDPPRQRDPRLAGLPALPIGHAGDGDNNGGRAVSYLFSADHPGLLTVAVRAKTGEDMTINIMNAQGRTLPDGVCDIDYNGDVGAEHLTVIIAEAGDYEVAVDPLSNGGPFWVSGSWLAVNELGDLAPKKPGNARALHPGDTVGSEVRGDRMSQDWYQFTAPNDGLVVFDVYGEGGDIILEIFTRNDFFEPSEYVDTDRRGNASNELYTGDLAEGETVYIRVVSQSSAGTSYRARARFLPAEDTPGAAE